MIKSVTDIEQSKRLAEILPIESADMFYFLDPTPFGNVYHLTPIQVDFGVKTLPKYSEGDVPCWSLAALLGVIKGTKLLFYTEDTPHRWCASVRKQESGEPAAVGYMGNPVDACELLISKLHKMGLL